MPWEAVIIAALPPADRVRRDSQPSSPRPLMITSFASTISLASAGARDRDADHAGDIARPEPRDAGGEDHQPYRQQGAERMKAVDQVDDDQSEERQMRRRTGPAHGAQEHRIDALDHQRAKDYREHDQ